MEEAGVGLSRRSQRPPAALRPGGRHRPSWEKGPDSELKWGSGEAGALGAQLWYKDGDFASLTLSLLPLSSTHLSLDCSTGRPISQKRSASPTYLCLLPTEANCSYFRFFTTGENNRILQRTTKKELGVAAAITATLALAITVLGCICVIMVLSKGAEFLLTHAAVFFSLSGLLLLVSLELFRQGVRELLARTGPGPAPWLGYEYSWSVACALAAAALLLLGGGSFLLLSLPSSTWGTCCHQHPDDRGAGGAGAT
ncbi:voltage-dependent calcium channel gamma-6 subunit [Sarcophilus harrisii]|uniref:voltage-dependent calcium channel gamma-6 subunit n=1 Tax=Sarcophilus harrisii TaxID=9305 RepID=UPI001301A8A7|nr:voltage-dependent calcium channel gamma-6 subunit [Sarcophilus harrisii]